MVARKDGSAKKIQLVPITRLEANAIFKRWHYSGRGYVKSWLHVGVELEGRLIGALSLGPGIDTRKSLCLVSGTPWDGYLELNRMAFVDDTPRCVESRALSILARMIKAHAPHVHWIVSYADTAQAGYGAVYQAVGWLLTGVRPNTTLYRTPSGTTLSDVGIRSTPRLRRVYGKSRREFEAAGLELLDGYQCRYLAPMRPDVRERLTSTVLPYSMARECASSGVASPRHPTAVDVRPDHDAPTQVDFAGRGCLKSAIRLLPRISEPKAKTAMQSLALF